MTKKVNINQNYRKKWYEQRYGTNETIITHLNNTINNKLKEAAAAGHPIVMQDSDGSEFSLADLDFENGFGLFDAVPGLLYLFDLSAPPDLFRGFINGSQIIKDKYMHKCDELVAVNLVNETERLGNLTITMFEQKDFFEVIFYMFDVALLATKILS